MPNYVEKEAKTVDEAVQLALDELQTDIDSVKVEVLEEGTKAVLGLFGGKNARVRVTRVFSNMETVTEYLNKIIEAAQIDATLEMGETEEGIDARIVGTDVGTLIGRHGETLYAIQYLANLILNQGRKEYTRVSLDIENYKKERQAKLEFMARRAADRVRRYRRPVSMDPMPSYERKIVHAALSEYPELDSTSSGEEPRRYVVVRLKGRDSER